METWNLIGTIKFVDLSDLPEQVVLPATPCWLMFVAKQAKHHRTITEIEAPKQLRMRHGEGRRNLDGQPKNTQVVRGLYFEDGAPKSGEIKLSIKCTISASICGHEPEDKTIKYIIES